MTSSKEEYGMLLLGIVKPLTLCKIRNNSSKHVHIVSIANRQSDVTMVTKETVDAPWRYLTLLDAN
jgi:hypothetical protein